MLVRSRISALIWDISGLWNRSDGRDYREKRIVISRFLALYMPLGNSMAHHNALLCSKYYVCSKYFRTLRNQYDYGIKKAVAEIVLKGSTCDYFGEMKSEI